MIDFKGPAILASYCKQNQPYY